MQHIAGNNQLKTAALGGRCSHAHTPHGVEQVLYLASR